MAGRGGGPGCLAPRRRTVSAMRSRARAERRIAAAPRWAREGAPGYAAGVTRSAAAARRHGAAPGDESDARWDRTGRVVDARADGPRSARSSGPRRPRGPDLRGGARPAGVGTPYRVGSGSGCGATGIEVDEAACGGPRTRRWSGSRALVPAPAGCWPETGSGRALRGDARRAPVRRSDGLVLARGDPGSASTRRATVVAAARGRRFHVKLPPCSARPCCVVRPRCCAALQAHAPIGEVRPSSRAPEAAGTPVQLPSSVALRASVWPADLTAAAER